LKIGLYLMTQKGLAVLCDLIDAFGVVPIAWVRCATDANQKDYYEDIRTLCREANILCLGPGDPQTPEADVAFAVSWRWMINAPEVGRLIILHDSLLPRYRGYSPLVSALCNGDKTIGVTAVLATQEMDAGPVVGRSEVEVDYPITIQKAIDFISGTYGRLAVGLCRHLLDGKSLEGAPQDERLASYSLWRDEADYRINWSDDAVSVRRFIDAVGSPYRGAKALLSPITGVLYQNKTSTVRIWAAEDIDDVDIENRAPGKVLFLRDGCPVVVCGRFLLKITRMTFEGGASALPMDRLRVRFI